MNDWAAHRRTVVFLIVGAVVVAVISVITFAAVYKAPTCTDGKQNQDEVGVDCGGSCSYLCSSQASAPTVLFSGLIRNATGRTDLIATVVNRNAAAAAKNVPFKVSLYGEDQSLVRTVQGTLDLPPRSTVPVFMPGVAVNSAQTLHAFLEITPDAPQWYALPTDPRIVPIVSHTTLGGTASAPRVDATLSNPIVATLTNVRVVALIHGTNGNVIGASETVVFSIPAQGQATATFSWNEPFTGVPLSVEVVPVIPLPDRAISQP